MYQHIEPRYRSLYSLAWTRRFAATSKSSMTMIIDHGNLVGDGNVNVSDHIDSGSAANGDVHNGLMAQATQRYGKSLRAAVVVVGPTIKRLPRFRSIRQTSPAI